MTRATLPAVRDTSHGAAMGAPTSLRPLQDESSSAQVVAAEKSSDSSNPFAMPADEGIFLMREQEKAAHRKQMEENRIKAVHEKSTFASRMGATITEASRARLPSRRAPPLPHSAEKTLAAAAMPEDRFRRDRERIGDFIAKKREIFLVQMSLDVKRAEIRKLEERILQREEALKKSEQMLEQDAVKFDEFLRENENKVNETIKRAEAEAKRRADKQIEIKRLHGKIAAMRSELNKHEEQLADCERYRRFLDDITPATYFQAIEREKQMARDAKTEAWQKECEAVRKAKADAADAKAQAEHDWDNARTQQEADRATEAKKTTAKRLAEVSRLKEPPPPKLNDDDHKHDDQMHFTTPQQLLDILVNLEEQNLFLIQTAQEVEESRDALASTFRATQDRMNREVKALQDTSTRLERAIELESEAVEILKERTHDGNNALFSHDVTLQDLSTQVKAMYNQCGLDDPSATTLQMLTTIETRMEEYLEQLHDVPLEFWQEQEKALEKVRRTRARDKKIKQDKMEQEARLQRALKRAAAPVYKKVGKPVMYRSPPVRKPKPVKVDTRDEEEVELELFLAREML